MLGRIGMGALYNCICANEPAKNGRRRSRRRVYLKGVAYHSIVELENRGVTPKIIQVDDTFAMAGWSAIMEMRRLLLNYEVALYIYKLDTIIEQESWMLDLGKERSSRQLHANRLSGLVGSVSRLFEPRLQ